MKSKKEKIHKNLLIVDKRGVGKTTYLYNEVLKLENQGKQIFILDSATEHEDKSLLRRIENNFSNTVTFCLDDEKHIIDSFYNIDEFKKRSFNSILFRQITNNLGNIICFDLSYFLERGYDNEKDFAYYRNLYNLLGQQLVLLLILMDKYDIIHNSSVIMDEIELPISDVNFNLLQKNISFLASVHPENSFGTFYSNFDKLDSKIYTYIRRD